MLMLIALVLIALWYRLVIHIEYHPLYVKYHSLYGYALILVMELGMGVGVGMDVGMDVGIVLFTILMLICMSYSLYG
ncbi:hypothetical protein LMH73_019655 [Vibrio splendidus]|nr:hypothetical protein [Vibrio splendidus]MCC4882466.1 hypothetical protein [Vibrio splendidus]